MSRTRSVVRVSVRDADGDVVRRLRLRLNARLPACVVLDVLLQRMLWERRCGLSVRIDEVPRELGLVLACCGFDVPPHAVIASGSPKAANSVVSRK